MIPIHRDHRFPEAVQNGGELLFPGQGSRGSAFMQQFVAGHASSIADRPGFPGQFPRDSPPGGPISRGPSTTLSSTARARLRL